jgi:hypothetical protein
MLNTKANSKKLLSTKEGTASNYESNIKRYKSQDVYQVGKRKFETKEPILKSKQSFPEAVKSPSKINNYISSHPRSPNKASTITKKIVNDESIQEQEVEEENSK